MSMMKQRLAALVGKEIKIYIPGKGFRIVKLDAMHDDVVNVTTLHTNPPKQYILHHSAVVIER